MGSNRMDQFQIYLARDDKLRLDRMSSETRRSKSDLMREALEGFLQKHGYKKLDEQDGTDPNT